MHSTNQELLQAYTTFLASQAHIEKPVTVVCDCSNGPTGIVLTSLHIPNLSLIIINDDIDPEFGAHGPNPTLEGALDQLKEKVRTVQADLGVAFDADGDRAIFITPQGRKIHSYEVVTSLSSQAVVDELTHLSIELLQPARTDIGTKVGRFFVTEKMQQTGSDFGAEYSGHYYFKQLRGADSAILALISVANILSTNPFPETPPIYIKDIQIPKTTEIETIVHTYKNRYPVLKEKNIDGVSLVGSDFWINIRPSNTEPIIRLTAAATTEPLLNSLLGEKVYQSE